MDLDPKDLENLDPLTLSNTITLSALVGLLIRKGVLTNEELVAEIRDLRQRIGAPESGAEPPTRP